MTEEQVFLAALDRPDTRARSAYLDEACGATALRRHVEALLASHFRSGEFLDVPAGEQIKAGRCDDNTRTHQGNAVSTEKHPDEESDGLEFLTQSSRPDSLGRIGHYEVLQVLGKGGFGIVFRAFDDTLQRVVAVKVMAPQLAATSPARKRFLREARTSAAVRHENVVQVYEVAEQPLPYLAMEFIPGETLQQMLDRTGPLDVTEVLRIGRQVAEGLAAAHATDLIHRDIKPSNVMIEGGPRHQVKITDFGLARAADDASISQSGIIAGTPMYMAPEQALGHKLDQRADLFSLGSVLYQMAAGRAPFRANSTVAVLKRVADDTPRDIREIIPETPQWLCDIIAKLHAKNPADRYQSAREVADVLADCEAQLKSNSKLKDFSRIPRSRQPAAWKSGRWKWAAAVVLLLPVIALAVTESSGVTHLLRNQQPTETVTPKVDPKVEPKTSPVTGSFALAFDGEKSLVKIPSLKITEDNALTLEAWTVLEQLVSPQTANLLGNPGTHVGFVLNAPTEFGGDGKKLAFQAGLKNRNTFALAWEVQPVPRHQLIHLAGVYDGKAEIRFYVNGQLQSRTPAEGVHPSPLYFILGSNSGGIDRFLGRMNEVRISKVARYDTDFTPDKHWPPDADTIALYHFDEGEGTVLKDSSGNGHHGEIVGAKWVKADGSAISSPPVGSPSPLSPTFKNNLGMEFVIVPKGKSWLGGGKDKPGDKEVEITADFYLGKYEVTQEEWEKVMGENPSHFSRTGGGQDAVKEISDAYLKRFPVENVSRDQCRLFVTKLNEREKESGWAYRLPKEVEWEYACRGGPMADKRDGAFDYYFTKPTNTLLPKQANFINGNSLRRTCKVGLYEPNSLGLYDMHGNVLEWCDDDFPPDPKSAADGPLRVYRGGDWSHAWDFSRVWTRNLGRGNLAYPTIGLRVARVPAGDAASEAKTLAAVAPFSDADVKRVAALPAAEQVVEVRKELMKRNPDFDGKFEHKIDEAGVVTELRINTDKVTDISPIRVFNSLRVLDCSGTYDNGTHKGQLVDLAPLKGMNLAGLRKLYLSFTKVSGAGLALFKDSKDLELLSLSGEEVSDAGLANFKGCNRVKSLFLAGDQLTDAGVACFKDCNLVHVWVHGPLVTDAGLAHLKVDDVKQLRLPGTQVTDAGLVRFKGCDLENLELHYTQVSDVGLAEFKGCKNLSRLNLTHCERVSDAGLAQFKDSKNLEQLLVDNTPITDAGLTHLAAPVGKLTELNMRETKVTAKGVEELAKALPKCKITWDGGVIGPK